VLFKISLVIDASDGTLSLGATQSSMEDGVGGRPPRLRLTWKPAES
jgi:hypothetical protein